MLSIQPKMGLTVTCVVLFQEVVKLYRNLLIFFGLTPTSETKTKKSIYISSQASILSISPHKLDGVGPVDNRPSTD